MRQSIHLGLSQSSAILHVKEWPMEADITELPLRSHKVTSSPRSRRTRFPCAYTSNISHVTVKTEMYYSELELCQIK